MTCKSISEYKICKRKQPNIIIRDSNSCEATLLRKTTKAKCHNSSFSLQRETFIPIQYGYFIIPLQLMNLDIACEAFVKHEEILTPKKLEGEKCKVYNEYDILYLSSTMTLTHRMVKRDL